MRIGVLGGSFDPPHLGHEYIATEAVAALNLDRLYLVPAYKAPFKEGYGANAEQRYAMVEIMCSSLNQQIGDRSCVVSRAEMDRKGTSYSWQTLEALRKVHHRDSMHLIIGRDQLLNFSRWQHWRRILEMAELLVFSRVEGAHIEGSRTGSPGEENIAVPAVPNALAEYANSVHFMGKRIVKISSTEIREAIGDKKPIADMLNRNVYWYIRDNSLYAI